MRSEQEFREVGHLILREFTFENEKYVFYRQNEYDPLLYITGEKYGWEFGLTYVPYIKNIAQIYYVSDELRKEIELHMPTGGELERMMQEIIKNKHAENNTGS